MSFDLKNKKNKYFVLIILAALAIKFGLWGYAAVCAPEGKFQIDSSDYMRTAKMLAEHGVFARGINQQGEFQYDYYRTPGYPLFLAVLNGILRVPWNGIIFIQLLLTAGTAYLTYRTALLLDAKIAPLSGLIVLLDPPVTIFSLIIATETLFLFFMALFMLVFVKYMKSYAFKLVLLSALILVLAAYVRPIAYYLAPAMVLFFLYLLVRTRAKRVVVHIVLFIGVFAVLVGPWQVRNKRLFGSNKFSSIDNATVKAVGLVGSYAKDREKIPPGQGPVGYYVRTTSHCLTELMTRPGSLKYFGSVPLKVAGKIFGYPFVVFWVIGFLAGLARMKGDPALHFLAYIVLYFICVTIMATILGEGSRFRVPMVPFIAILSAHGWVWLREKYSRNFSFPAGFKR